MEAHRHDPRDLDAEPCCPECCDCETLGMGKPDFTLMPHIVLDGRVAVWYDAETCRVVMYEFDDDTGISVSLDEWRRMIGWANAQAGIPDYYSDPHTFDPARDC